jgi:hypothetical protein
MRAAGVIVGWCALAMPGWWLARFFPPKHVSCLFPSAAWLAVQAVLLPISITLAGPASVSDE